MSIEIGPETVNEITDRESRDTVEQRCTPSDGLSPDSQACVRALALVVHHPRHAPGGGLSLLLVRRVQKATWLIRNVISLRVGVRLLRIREVLWLLLRSNDYRLLSWSN